MTSLQTLLAGFKDNLLLYAIIAAAAILLIVFIVGVVKGFFRVGKGGFVWAIAGLGFIFLYKWWMKKGLANPVQKIFKSGFLYKSADFVWGMLLLFAVAVVVLILRAALAAIFGVERKSKPKTTVTDSSEGFEYELDDVVEGYYGKTKSKYELSRERSPGIVSRMLGGITALLNLVIILAVIGGVALFVVDVLKVSGGVNGLLGASFGNILHKYILPYVLDFITVGIVFAIICHGFYTGTIGFTRSLLMKFGAIVAIVLGFAIPFVKPFNNIGFVESTVATFANLFAKTGSLQVILGAIATGAVFAIVGVILMAIINFLLKKLMELIQCTVVLRFIDGVLATVVYLVLALLLCFVLWSALYLLNNTGIFKLQEFLGNNTFSKTCFDAASSLLGDVVKLFKK